MKKIIILLLIVFSSSFLPAQPAGISQPLPFQPGEKLTYRIYFESALSGEINAGLAFLEIKEENKKIAGKSTFHLVMRGKTIGAVNIFFKVRDRFDSYISRKTLLPLLYLRRTFESGYTASEDITFDHEKNIAYLVDNKRNKTKDIPVPERIHDLLSAYYYARTMDVEEIKKGGNISMKFLFTDSVYTTKAFYEGIENIDIYTGTYRCMRFKPKVITGNVFEDDYPLTVWISDDKNRIPLKVESDIIVGFVKLELIAWEKVKYPFDSLVEKD